MRTCQCCKNKVHDKDLLSPCSPRGVPVTNLCDSCIEKLEIAFWNALREAKTILTSTKKQCNLLETQEKYMNEKEKALEVYDRLFNATASFEPIADTLCYLFPAILRDNYIEIDMNVKNNADFYNLLSKTFAKDHFVWEYIKIVE